MTKPFDKPTNTWLEEEVEVTTYEPEFDKETESVKIVQKKLKVPQRTYYADSKPQKLVCANHVYACINKGKYMFRCKNRGCSWHRIAPPVSFRFDPQTGILTRRDTGERV